MTTFQSCSAGSDGETKLPEILPKFAEDLSVPKEQGVPQNRCMVHLVTKQWTSLI